MSGPEVHEKALGSLIIRAAAAGCHLTPIRVATTYRGERTGLLSGPSGQDSGPSLLAPGFEPWSGIKTLHAADLKKEDPAYRKEDQGSQEPPLRPGTAK